MNTDRLAKLLALASSDTDAEALAALRKAKSLLTGAGLDFKHVAERVSADNKADSASSFSYAWPPHRAKEPEGFTAGTFTWRSKADQDAFWAQEQALYERTRQQHEGDRAKVLEKYGSEENAVARDPKEQALHDAARPWLTEPFPQPPDAPYLADRWHRRMGEYEDLSELDAAPMACRAALEAAIPMPSTVRTARDEYRAWEDRDREVQHAIQCWSASQLDLPAQWRRERVRLLYERDMPIQTLDDLHVRLDYAVKSDFHPERETFLSILDGFERLVVNAESAAVQSESSVRASDRRAAVLSMLSNPDTAGWSDRAIARAVGVSPTTVGTLRRRAAS